MPNLNKTELAVIMDRSGSMSAIRRDMEGGFKTFIEDQLKEPGELFVSLYQFDDQFDVRFEEVPGHKVPAVELVPRGWTALYDAIGKASALIGERLAKKPESERPGAVIVLVITDGEENRSTEYSRDRIRELVKHQETIYNWRFAYLGSSDAGLAEAQGIFTPSAIASFDANSQGVQANYASASKGLRGYRHAVANNVVDATMSIASTGSRSDNK
jgi:hypothetical protein